MKWIIVHRHPLLPVLYRNSLPKDRLPRLLLGTTRVYIKLGHVIFSARSLIDPASEATFISRKLQRKLDLPTFLAPAANVVVANSKKVCIISLGSPTNPLFRLTTEAYVVEQLTGQLPTC